MRISYIVLGLSLGLILINTCLANKKEDGFESFMNRVLDNSNPIKIKMLELESEGYKAKQTDYFYLPKVSATSKLKHGDANVNSSLTATSLIYDSALNHRFNEKELKLKVSQLNLNKEKDELYASITNNLLSIHFLNELTKKTANLNKNSKEIFDLIDRRYKNGVAKSSDLEQAMLLMQRIDIEQKNIEKEIMQYKSNIELISGLDYPVNGVSLPKNFIKNIHNIKIQNDQSIQNNIEYNILKIQANVIKENAQQQDSFFNVNLIAEERYLNQSRNHSESYVGVELKLNIFDIDKKLNELSQLKLYEAAKGKVDYKHSEMTAKVKNLNIIATSNEIEINNLKNQRDTLSSMIKSQEREYDISQSSFYEMVNTLFDMLTIERRITESMIADMKNKMEYIQLTGKLAEIENPS